jgi:hypothetical protein
METVEVSDNPVVNSDEQLFTFGSFELKLNGKLCYCPVVEAGSPHGVFDEFVDEFDAEASEKIDAHGSSSELSGVETEAEDMMKVSSTGYGVMTETAAKRIVERMTHFDPQREPLERKKEAAQQACAVAEELGWDDVIPDEDDRNWYELN